MKTLDQKMNEISAERRQKIEDRAAQLIAEELSLKGTIRKNMKENESLACIALPILFCILLAIIVTGALHFFGVLPL